MRLGVLLLHEEDNVLRDRGHLRYDFGKLSSPAQLLARNAQETRCCATNAMAVFDAIEGRRGGLFPSLLFVLDRRVWSCGGHARLSRTCLPLLVLIHFAALH